MLSAALLLEIFHEIHGPTLEHTMQLRRVAMLGRQGMVGFGEIGMDSKMCRMSEVILTILSGRISLCQPCVKPGFRAIFAVFG